MGCVWQTVGGDGHIERVGEPLAAERLQVPAEHRATPRAASARFRVAIGVCTAFRPKMLTQCLDAIASQSLPDGIIVHVVVVDNEPERSSERLVRELSARCPFSVHYVHEPRRGIPQARNAVLVKCRSLGTEWIAFTDDDCRVNPDWLASLLMAAARHKADVIYGRREFVLSQPAPFRPARVEQAGYREGQVLPYAATHNVLFAASLLQSECAPGLTFDERLAHGEDTDFFHRRRAVARASSTRTPPWSSRRSRLSGPRSPIRPAAPTIMRQPQLLPPPLQGLGAGRQEGGGPVGIPCPRGCGPTHRVAAGATVQRAAVCGVRAQGSGAPGRCAGSLSRPPRTRRQSLSHDRWTLRR
jgi:hypothetical protein